jgi:hypothetical protein
MTQTPTEQKFFLKYDTDWEVWALWQHTPGVPDRLLAEFCDGTPEGSQLATLVLDLLTAGSTIADEVEAQGTNIPIVTQHVIQDQHKGGS